MRNVSKELSSFFPHPPTRWPQKREAAREDTRKRVCLLSRDEVRKLKIRFEGMDSLSGSIRAFSSVFNVNSFERACEIIRVRYYTGFCRVLDRFKHVDGSAEICEGVKITSLLLVI